MARRKIKESIDKKAIIEAFSEMAKHKSIDRDLLQAVLEETLSMIVRKKYGMESIFEIIVNMEKGDIEIYLTKQVVGEVVDPETEISVEEANRYSSEPMEEGDDFIEEITLDNIADSFGRRLISLASQNLNQRIREIEKDNVYNEYEAKVGEIIVGEIHQVRRHDILIMHNKIEMKLPRVEQIPNEPYKYKKNHTLKVLLKEVVRTTGGSQPEIIVSRADDKFLARLFEVEIPEIYDGIITIKGIARDPGERSKVAVSSFDDRIDPVGACVGMKGIRIHSIVRELNNENIDLIEYSDDMAVFVARALSPAKIKDISLNVDAKIATVTVTEDQVSLAIGKNGQNVKLASKLTGYSITLIKEGGEDIELIEFEEEMGPDIYDDLTDLGYETARDFLNGDIEELMEIEGMSKEMLIELRTIVLNEFDEEENQEVLDVIMEYKKKPSKKETKATTKDVEQIIDESKTDENKEILDIANI